MACNKIVEKARSNPSLDEKSAEFIREIDYSTKYSVINLNVSSMPVKIRFGMCIPSVCSQDDMSLLSINVTSALSSYIATILDSRFNP